MMGMDWAEPLSKASFIRSVSMNIMITVAITITIVVHAIIIRTAIAASPTITGAGTTMAIGVATNPIMDTKVLAGGMAFGVTTLTATTIANRREDTIPRAGMAPGTNEAAVITATEVAIATK